MSFSKNIMTINDKINVLYETVKTLNYLPTSQKRVFFNDGTKMHTFWHICKLRNRFDKNPYKKLLEIDVLKNDYESYLLNYHHNY